MAEVHFTVRLLLIALVLMAGGIDILRRRIPNWLTVTGALAGIVLNCALSGLEGLKASAGGVGLALLIYVPLYMLCAIGGGDVKLMAAVGAVAGPSRWLAIFLITSLLGGVLALFVVLIQGRARRVFSNVWFILRELARFRPPHARREELDVHSPKAITLPHGAVIALGTIAYLSSLSLQGR